MTKYFYYIEALPELIFSSLAEAREGYKAIMKKDGISAQKIRSNSPVSIIRQSYTTGDETQFSI